MHSATEEPKCWMWTRRRFGGRPPYIPSLSIDGGVVAAARDDSWEERAFADDSSGRLGGCVWPPRSYSCSFCRREFRSAQALGGHMNVHRRDRARLRQSPPGNPLQDTTTTHHHHLLPRQQHHPQARLYYPSVACGPNHRYSHGGAVVSSSATPLSTPTNLQENCTQQKCLLASPPCPSYSSSSSINQGPQRCKRSLPHTNAVPARDEQEINGRGNSKKQRTGDHQVAPSFHGQDLDAGLRHPKSKVLAPDPFTAEELDLELRLGDRPRIA